MGNAIEILRGHAVIRAILNGKRDLLESQPTVLWHRFDVPPSGQIQVAVPGLLRHYPPAYRARYAD